MRARTKGEFNALSMLIGRSAAMDETRALISQAARAVGIPVLILGETGTGKELVARAIVRLSGAKMFVPVNCAELSEEIADSELFGHERGAFTNAFSATTGLVGAANGGVLFLDELAELPLRVQAKLLRALESGEYRRVGSTRQLESSYRLLAATNGDVDALVASGELREDFTQRLGGFRIVLAPLRSRPGDIRPLATYFLKRYQQEQRDAPRQITEAAVQLLIGHAWPGNVRELRNVIRTSAALAAPACRLDADHVGEVLMPPSPSGRALPSLPTLEQARRAAGQQVIRQALARTNGNRKQAAKLLGISTATLYRLLKEGREGSRHGRSGVAKRDGETPMLVGGLALPRSVTAVPMRRR